MESFENEYSRLIPVLGKDSLLKLQKSKILVSGMKGLGAETGKKKNSQKNIKKIKKKK